MSDPIGQSTAFDGLPLAPGAFATVPSDWAEKAAAGNPYVPVVVAHGLYADVPVFTYVPFLSIVVVPTSIFVEPTSVTLAVTDTQQLTATVFDQNGAEIVDADVTWASDDEDVATVDSDGLVTAVATGSCTITGSSGPLSDTCAVVVIGTDPDFADVIFLLDGTQPGIVL